MTYYYVLQNFTQLNALDNELCGFSFTEHRKFSLYFVSSRFKVCLTHKITKMHRGAHISLSLLSYLSRFLEFSCSFCFCQTIFPLSCCLYLSCFSLSFFFPSFLSNRPNVCVCLRAMKSSFFGRKPW